MKSILSKRLKNKAKTLNIRITKKVNGKRVYKTNNELIKQIKQKKQRKQIKQRKNKFSKNKERILMNTLTANAAEKRIEQNDALKQLQELVYNPNEVLDIKTIYDLLVKNKIMKNASEIYTEETREVLIKLSNREIIQSPKLKVEKIFCVLGKSLSKNERCCSITIPKLKIDKTQDKFIGIDKYLSEFESKGPDEDIQGSFENYKRVEINFLLILLEENEDNFQNKTKLCIPPFNLCVYKIPDIPGSQNQYEVITKKDITSCDETNIDRRILLYDELDANMILINSPIASNWEPLESKKKMKLFYPDNLNQLIENCKNNNKRIILFKLSLIERKEIYKGHANIILFDLKNKTIERFDPHGGSEYKDGNNIKKGDAYYNQLNIDLKLYETFIDTKILSNFNFTYIGVNKICPFSLGPQCYVDKFQGLCSTWISMYILLRILNPDLSQEQITNSMINHNDPEKILKILLRFNRFMADKLRRYSKEAINKIRNKNLHNQQMSIISSIIKNPQKILSTHEAKLLSSVLTSLPPLL